MTAANARHPALLAALCLCIGVVTGDRLNIAPGWMIVVTLTAGALGMRFVSTDSFAQRTIGNIAVILALIAFGAWRISAANAGRPSESLLELASANKRVEMFARVDGVPFQKQSGWRVPLDLIAIKSRSGDVPVDGRALLTSIPTLSELRYGDFIRFEGRAYAPSVQRNPGGFDYANYLHRQGFDATVRPETPITLWPQDRAWSLVNIMEPVRQWIRGTFGEYLHDQQRALLVGLLLGDTDRLPRSIYDAFRESGTSHLLAVSGANVWLVVGMILLPMYALAIPRWPRTIIALAVILMFSFLTRNEPSVVRASLMAGLILIGRLLWRPVAPLNAVGAAAMIILIFAPSHLFRPGFQLSFAAVFGILIAVSRVEPLLTGFWRRKWVYAIVMFLVASVAATVATAPISAWHFGTVPVAGVISNLIMVPLAGLTAHLGLALLPLQTLSSTVGSWLAWVTEKLLTFSTEIAQFFSSVPWAVVSWSAPSPLILSHMLLAVFLLLNWRHRYRWLRPLTHYICFLIVLIAATRLSSPRETGVSISLLDTGRQRIVILSTSDRSAIGLVDDPGVDEEIDQWVIKPFLRYHIGSPKLNHWMSWCRLDTSEPMVSPETSMAGRWKRFYTRSDSGSTGASRVWADRWEVNSTSTVLVRDVPDLTPADLTRVIKPTSTSPQLILPAQAETAWTREVVNIAKPKKVVFYGKFWHSRSPDEILSFWRIRYPGIEFYSSAVHGGLTIDMIPEGAPVIPTIAENPLSPR